MIDYKKIILNILLNKYEKSKSYLQEVNRKIAIKCLDLKEYNIYNVDEKTIFHDTLKELKNKNIVDFSWLKYEENNILASVWLIKENVTLAYKEIGRSVIKSQAEESLELLKKYKNTFKNEWINRYINEMISYIEITKKNNSFFNYEYKTDIIKALLLIDKGEEYLKRVFSIKCYNDSKYFEKNIEKHILKILKKYLETECESIEIEDEQLLIQVGIVKSPEEFEFCGEIKAKVNNKTVDFGAFLNGTIINSLILNDIEFIEHNIKKVLFIENKTNYIDYIINKKTKDELVIYHGGMYSNRKKILFEKIYNFLSNKEILFFHWSDIDIGGFNIFLRLKEQIIPNLQPYMMDKEAFTSVNNGYLDISKEYKEKLVSMKDKERYSMFKEVINEMINKSARLEQEAFLIN